MKYFHCLYNVIFTICNLLNSLITIFKKDYIYPNGDIQIGFSLKSIIFRKNKCSHNWQPIQFLICSIKDGDECSKMFNEMIQTLPTINARNWPEIVKTISSSNSTDCFEINILPHCILNETEWDRLTYTLKFTKWKQIIIYVTIVDGNLYSSGIDNQFSLLNVYDSLNKSDQVIKYFSVTLLGLLQININLKISCEISYYGENCSIFCPNDYNTKCVREFQFCPKNMKRIMQNIDVATFNCRNNTKKVIGDRISTYCLYVSVSNCPIPLFLISITQDYNKCIIFPIVYSSNKNPQLKNVTYLTVEATERISLSLSEEFLKIKKKNQFLRIPVYNTNEMEIINDSVIVIRKDATISCCKSIEIVFYFYTWKSFSYSIVVTYSVFERPRDIKLNVTRKFIYIGEFVEIQAKGYPESLFTYDAYVLSDNFDLNGLPPYHSVFQIPNYSNVGTIKFLLFANLSLPNRPMISTGIVRNYIIKAYSEFRLGSINRIAYFPREIIICTFNAYVQPEIVLHQLNGKTKLNKVNERFKIRKNTIGGVYSLSCGLRFPKSHFEYSRIIRINIFAPPTTVCIQAFPELPGAYISCVNDGFDTDLVKSKLSFYNKRNHLLLQAENLLRVPFLLKLEFFIIICHVNYFNPVVKNSISENSKQVEKKYQINKNGSDLRIKQNVECSKFAFLYYLKFYISNSNEKSFVPEIFDLKEVISNELAILQWLFAIYITMIIILGFGISFLFKSVKKTRVDMLNSLRKSRMKIKASSLNHCLTIKTFFPNFFQNEKFFAPYVTHSETFSSHFSFY